MGGAIGMTERNGTFILGLGAQKTGSSWLHAQLNRRRDAEFGFLKEYHIHDALTLPEAGFSNRRQRSLIKPRTWRRQRFMAQPQRYYDYFASLLRRPGIQLTGDITPSYSALKPETLRVIQAGFAEREIPIRPIFLMRDPIERIISYQRMQLRKQNQLNRKTEVEALRQLCIERPVRVMLRSDYGHTLMALTQVFEPSECFIDLYERLFTPASWKHLCDVLKVPYEEPDWGQQVNVSRTDTSIPDEILAELGDWQAPTMAAVRQTMGHLDLAQLWPLAHRWCTDFS
jgi:hypothetical protein